MYTVTTSIALDPSYAGASLRIQYYSYDSVNNERDAVGSPVSTGIFELPGGDGLFAIVLVVQDGLVGWADIYDNADPTVILASVPINPRELEYSDAPTSDIADAIEALGATGNITVISAVNGSTVTVYRNDTWDFTMTIAGVVLTSYEAVAFIVKSSENQADERAVLYVRSDDGLLRIGGEEADDAGAGSLTVDSATEFTVHVDIDQTDVQRGGYKWWLKVFETGTTPDEGYTRATGVFTVTNYGLRAIE